MFTGDSLAVVLWLAAAALACMVAAIPLGAGKPRSILWGMCAIFALGTVGWMVPSSTSPVIRTLSAIAASLVRSGALTMVGTIFIVSLMKIGDKNQIVADKSPTNDCSIDDISVITQIENALKNADWEGLRAPDQVTINSCISILDSVFITLRKAYGMTTPALQKNLDSMLWGARFLKTIFPYLYAGHVEEAKQAAERFLQS